MSADFPKEALEEAILSLYHIEGVLDCLYMLACKNPSSASDGLGLSKGNLSNTLDLLIKQAANTRDLLERV